MYVIIFFVILSFCHKNRVFDSVKVVFVNDRGNDKIDLLKILSLIKVLNDCRIFDNKNNLFMAAPAGNEFWMQRTKHGRDRLFSDPDIFWEECVRYFTWCVNNPLYEEDFRGKDADRVEIRKMRAFTWAGLEVFLDCDLRRYRAAVSDEQNTNSLEMSEDFVRVLSRVSKVMFTQQYEGAAAGLLNSNLAARYLSISEKTETKNLNINQNDYVDYSEVSDEALKEIKNARQNKRLSGNS